MDANKRQALCHVALPRRFHPIPPAAGNGFIALPMALVYLAIGLIRSWG